METRLDYLPTSPFPRNPLALGPIYAGGAGPQLNNLDLENTFHAFKVYVLELRQPRAKFGVEYKSTLFKGPNTFQKITITGLLTNRLNFQDSGWAAFPSDEKIVYLKGIVSNGEVTSVEVEWDWTPDSLASEKRVDITNGRQTAFYLPIARLFRYGSDPVRFGVEQYVTSNLVLSDVVIDGVVCKYPTVDPLSVQFAQYAFQLIPCQENGSAAIRVSYGEINGETPDGMVEPSSGDPQGGYVMSNLPSGWIYAIVTFDQQTREISTRTIGYGGSIPQDEELTVNFPIGKVELVNVANDSFYRVIHQAQCGSINFAEGTLCIGGEPHLQFYHVYARTPIPISMI